jgi:hypothetical protein
VFIRRVCIVDRREECIFSSKGSAIPWRQAQLQGVSPKGERAAKKADSCVSGRRNSGERSKLCNEGEVRLRVEHATCPQGTLIPGRSNNLGFVMFGQQLVHVTFVSFSGLLICSELQHEQAQRRQEEVDFCAVGEQATLSSQRTQRQGRQVQTDALLSALTSQRSTGGGTLGRRRQHVSLQEGTNMPAVTESNGALRPSSQGLPDVAHAMPSTSMGLTSASAPRKRQRAQASLFVD